MSTEKDFPVPTPMNGTGVIRLPDLPVIPEAYQDPYQVILQRQEEMQATLDAILAKFQVIAEEVKPLITTVSEHPFMKMLGKGKK